MDDTVELLKECNSGLQMAINGISYVIDDAKGKEFNEMLENYEKQHKDLCKIVHKELHDRGYQEREPNPMIKTEAWMQTKMKMLVDSSDEKIADLMMDGCNMGIKSVGKYLNQYEGAEANTKSLANDVIELEENFMKDLKKFL